MRYIKTYGMSGLLEWYGSVSFGSINIKLAFTNGSVTAYGVSPAEYTTSDKLTQFVIENSEDFKSGRIFVVRYFEIPEVAVAKEEESIEEEVVEASVKEADEKQMTVIEVADKNEAIDYLKEHFGGEYTATKLRTKGAFDSACEECGVRFTFTE